MLFFAFRKKLLSKKFLGRGDGKKNASHSLLYATCAVSEIDISRAAQVVHSSFKLAVSCKFDFFLLRVSDLSHIRG